MWLWISHARGVVRERASTAHESGFEAVLSRQIRRYARRRLGGGSTTSEPAEATRAVNGGRWKVHVGGIDGGTITKTEITLTRTSTSGDSKEVNHRVTMVDASVGAGCSRRVTIMSMHTVTVVNELV